MSYQTLNESAAPSTPAAGKGSEYLSTAKDPRHINSQGVDVDMTAKLKYNWLRNSGFWFAQRQTPGTLTTYSSVATRAITADGWGVTNENASVQYIRVDARTALETGLTSPFYGQFSKITSAGKVVVTQMLEGLDTSALHGRTVRVQMLLKASANATFKIALVSWTGNFDGASGQSLITAFGANGVDPTLGANHAFVAPKAGVTPDNATVGANAISCAVTTVWQRFGGVFDVPTGARNLVVMVWSDSQMAAAATLSISEAMLSDGAGIQLWCPQTYVMELKRCQRFYQKTFAVDTAPVQNAGLTQGAMRGILGKTAAVANAAILFRAFDPPMIANPTTVTYNPSAANAQVRQTTGTAADLSATGGIVDATGFNVTATGAATGAIGDAVAVHYSADAEL